MNLRTPVSNAHRPVSSEQGRGASDYSGQAPGGLWHGGVHRMWAASPAGQFYETLANRWVGRTIGGLWLAGAAAFLLLTDADGDRTRTAWILAVAAATVGTTLLFVRLDRLHPAALDVLLLMSSTAAHVAALLLPDVRTSTGMGMLWMIPFAFALLPPGRALLQAGYVLVLTGITTAALVWRADTWSEVTDALGRWLLLAVTVTVIGLAVWRLSAFLCRQLQVAEAVAELGRRALNTDEPDELLGEALQLATAVIGCDYGTALRRLPGGELGVAAEIGPVPLPPDTVLPIAARNSYAMRVVESPVPFISGDLRSDTRVTPPLPLLARGVVSGLAVPVTGSDGVVGVLALHDSRPNRFSRSDIATATALAHVVAVAWQRTLHREAEARLTLYEDRERIALDLHDFVIQRVFAAGLSLQSLRRHLPEGAPRERLDDIAAELDAAIIDIRSTIYSLQRDPEVSGDLRQRVLEIGEAAARWLNFRPGIVVSGDIDAEAVQPLAKDVLAVVGEGLSNIAHHAGATSATVHVAVSTRDVSVSITDNGRGMDEHGHRSGLNNLRLRAERHGGSLQLLSEPGAGTNLLWQVPLVSERAEGRPADSAP